MARVTCGTQITVGVDNATAALYRQVFDLLAYSGESRLVPFPGTDEDGDQTVIWMMCGPGIPLAVIEDGPLDGDLGAALLGVVQSVTGDVEDDGDDD